MGEEASAVRQEARELNSELSQWRQTALGPELSQEESCRRLCDELIAEALKGKGDALALLVSPAISNARKSNRILGFFLPCCCTVESSGHEVPRKTGYQEVSISTRCGRC